MNESMYRYMKVGLIHFMAFPEVMKGEGPVLETMKKIAVDEFFNAIEISWIKDPETRKQAKFLLETSHLTAGYGGQPRLLTTGLNINDTEEEGRLKAVATLKEGIDEAYEMGCAGFAFLSGKYEEAKKEQAFEALLKSTRDLCAYAKGKGDLKIIHEVFDYDVDKKSLIGPAALAKRYAEEIRKEFDNFGLLADLSHLPLIRETAREAILPIKEYIVHAHLGNCVVKDKNFPAYGDAHPRFGFSNGENDVPEVVEFLKTLLEIGFLNTLNPPIVSFEIKPFGEEDPELVIANAKRVLTEAWAKL